MNDFIHAVGSSTPKYLILGDNWTSLGLKLNQAFTGNADTLLRAVLKEAKVPLSECAFANAVPTVPGNKVLKGHVDTYRDALYHEIQRLQPKVILACGTWAAQAALNKQTPLAELRGFPYWNIDLQCYIIATYHPGAISYNPTLFEEFGKDVEKLRRIADMAPGGLVREEPNTVTISSLEQYLELREKILHPDDDIMSVDIETDGFDYFKDPILSIGVGPTDKDVYIFNREMCDNPEMRPYFEELLGLPNIIYVYQNGKFDVQFMKADPDPAVFGYKKLCVVSTCRCDFDTMLGHYCTDERQGTHGLKIWAREEFDAPDWEKGIEKYLPRKDTPYSAIPEIELHKYQGYDVFYTRKGYYRFKDKMIEDDTYGCFNQVYVPAVPAFTDIELEGIPIDRKRLVELYEEAQPRIAQAAEELAQAAKDAGWDPMKYAQAKNEEKMQKWRAECSKINPAYLINPDPTDGRIPKKPGGTEVPKVFNPKSHPQLSYVAYDLCGLPLYEGAKTCNKDAVDVYRHRHPFWAALANYKEVSDLFGTFIKGMLERTDKDDRIRPDFMLHGTKTGRISCSNPNMQNLPRGSVVKDFFVADPGCVVCNADYKTLEVVIASILSGDEEMQRPFIEGLDFHTQTAQSIFGEEIAQLQAARDRHDRDFFIAYCEKSLMLEIRHKVHDLLDEDKFEDVYRLIWGHLRFLTKFVTFGIMYGRGAESLAKGELNCTILEATQYVNAFFDKYPKYKAWLKAQEKSAIEKGYVQNIFGFKRRWPFITNDLLHEIRNQSWNTPVQGSASMVCMQALCRCQAKLKSLGWGRILFTVHDSIVSSLSIEHLQEALTLVYDEMTKDIIGTPVKLEVELEVGPTYKRVDGVHKENGIWIPDRDTNEWLTHTLKGGMA